MSARVSVMLTMQLLRPALFPPGLLPPTHHRHSRRAGGPSGEEALTVGLGQLCLAMREARRMAEAYGVDTAEAEGGGSHCGGPDQLHSWLGGDDILNMQLIYCHDDAELSDRISRHGLLSKPSGNLIGVCKCGDHHPKHCSPPTCPTIHQPHLLTASKYDLYISSVACGRFYSFSRHYGDCYLTRNVQFLEPYIPPCLRGHWEEAPLHVLHNI